MRFSIKQAALAVTAAWLATVTVSGAILAGDTDLGAIWCIGDSIMQSNADGNGNSSPRLSLYNQLTAAGYTFTYTGHHTLDAGGLPETGALASRNLYQYHSGISGYTIQQHIDTLTSHWNDGRLASVKPNVIVIMIGTNDTDRIPAGDNHAASVSAAGARLTTLLNNIFALPGIGDPTVILSNIPPNGRSTLQSTDVINFNALLPGIVSDFQTAGKSIVLADIYTLINSEYSSAMVSDNLHTNTYGNGLLAQGWFDAINGLVIPEPSTWALMVSGGATLLALARKRK